MQLRAEGARHDVLAAVLGRRRSTTTSPACSPAPTPSPRCSDTDDGANLLAAYRRAANILRIEERKDGPHDGPIDAGAAGSSRRNSRLAVALDRDRAGRRRS